MNQLLFVSAITNTTIAIAEIIISKSIIKAIKFLLKVITPGLAFDKISLFFSFFILFLLFALQSQINICESIRPSQKITATVIDRALTFPVRSTLQIGISNKAIDAHITNTFAA